MHSWTRYLAALCGKQVAARLSTTKARGERMWSSWTIKEGNGVSVATWSRGRQARRQQRKIMVLTTEYCAVCCVRSSQLPSHVRSQDTACCSRACIAYVDKFRYVDERMLRPP